MEGFEYSQTELCFGVTPLARVLVKMGIVEDVGRFEDILRDAYVETTRVVDSRWNCVSWMRGVWELLRADAGWMGTGNVPWSQAQTTGLKFVRKLEDEGVFGSNEVLLSAPTWDMLAEREVACGLPPLRNDVAIG